MARGGKRQGAGRRKRDPNEQRPLNAEVARRIKEQIKAEKLWVFAVATAVQKAKSTGNTTDLVRILEIFDKREFGNYVDTVNHLHDKPIDLNVNLSMAEIIREVRERKQNYERTRK